MSNVSQYLIISFKFDFILCKGSYAFYIFMKTIYRIVI